MRYAGNLCRHILSFMTIASLSATANAQTTGGDSNEIVFTPYLWGTSLNGTSAFGALPPLDIDASFSDLFSNLNFAASLHTEFHRGPWVFTIDPMYVSVEADVAPEGVPLPPGSAPKIGVDMWFVELWGGYQFADHWEIIGGARWQSQDLDVSGLPSPPLPIPGISISEDWTDWFGGLRFASDIGEKWFFTWRGDIVFAGDSDSSINTSVMFNRRFGQTMSLNLGYRYFEDDYDNLPSYAWDMTQEGPIVGYTWVF